MRTIALAFAVGVLLARSKAGAPEPSAAAASETDAADLRFLVQLGERANDRVLDDIRAFNAVAYTLLGPLLAIAAFVDYHDARNVVPLTLTLCATVMTFISLRSRDGLPTPSLADVRLFDTFADDASWALRNVLADLRRWGFANACIRERKRRALLWAGRFVMLAMIATILIKGVEWGEIMRRTSTGNQASPPAGPPENPNRTVRNTRFDVAPSERHSFAYDLATNTPVSDDDYDAYMERINRPWWRFW